MKICPKCGKVLSYNSYFGGYICMDCSWEDVSIGIERNKSIPNYTIVHYTNNSLVVETKKMVAHSSN